MVMQREPKKRSINRFWLTALIHLDSIRISPKIYAMALLWRARGMRVRSRNMLASLLATSRYAYPLWISKQVSPQGDRDLATVPQLAQQLLPVVEHGADATALQRTLESLALSGLGQAVIILLDEQIDPPAEQDIAGVRTHISRSLSDFLDHIGQLKPAWLLPMLSGDRISPAAPAEYDAYVRRGDSGVVYADDDALDDAGIRHSPHFKPDWNPELFEHQDYLSFACIVRAEHVVALRHWSSMDWARDLVTAALGAGTKRPAHLPAVLHHRTGRTDAMIKAPPVAPGLFASDAPSVTIIIPTRNHIDILRTCLEGVRKTSYPNFKCVVVDNDSDDPEILELFASFDGNKFSCLKFPGEFNYSKINNYAVEMTQSDFICFLNNDIEMRDSQWLDILMAHAIKPGIGAVGPKLLYPDQTIQHAGIVLGMGGAAGHAHRFSPNTEATYFNRPHLPQRISAVTGACLVVRRAYFEKTGGLDEVNFPVAFNDVDLCLKLTKAGLINIYEPLATLIHHESLSRGSDMLKSNKNRFRMELANLKAIWHTDSIVDPWHNINLSRLTEQFIIDLL